MTAESGYIDFLIGYVLLLAPAVGRILGGCNASGHSIVGAYITLYQSKKGYSLMHDYHSVTSG